MSDNPFMFRGQPLVAPSAGGSTGLWAEAGAFLASNFSDDVMDWLGFGDDSETATTPAPSGNGQSIGGCQITVPVQVKQRASCPPGYVVVHPPGQGKQCMLKGVAIKCGLYKQPKKPPISASDYQSLRKADRTVKKIERMVAMANNVQGKNPMRRVKRGG